MPELAGEASDLDIGSAPFRPALHHVNLKTSRLDAMVDWYRVVLGMEPVYQFEGGAWLTNDTANHRLALLSTPRISDDPEKLVHAGLHHTAFEYADLDELLATYLRLRSLGIRPHSVLDHGMTLSFYYLDPDENSVELQIDHFRDWEKSTEFMGGSLFGNDPIGTFVDPDRMVAEWASGVSAQEIHRRAYRGDFPPAAAQDLRVPFA